MTANRDHAHALGIVTGRREMLDWLAAELRRRAAEWRSERQPAGLWNRVQAALLWSVTELWCSRLEQLAGELERQSQAFAADEQRRRQALEQPRRKRWPWSS